MGVQPPRAVTLYAVARERRTIGRRDDRRHDFSEHIVGDAEHRDVGDAGQLGDHLSRHDAAPLFLRRS